MKYQCEICHRIYDKEGAALACESKPYPPTVAAVGDIVLLKAGYGWFDGRRNWISNPGVMDDRPPYHGNCFSDCCTYAFYYVVTAIDHEGHRNRYHVATMAIRVIDECPYLKGWTTDDGGHIKLRKVENPPEDVVRESKALIGQKSNQLI